MLRLRFAFAFSALAVLLGCNDDPTTAPTNSLAFQGISWIATDGTGNLVVTWKPAPDAVEYRVYVSRLEGRALKTSPVARTTGSSVVVTPEKVGEKYYLVVRAVDAGGLEGGNSAEKSVIANPDKTAPTFPGVKTVEPTNNAGFKLTWDPATDDSTPAEAITYDVYTGRARGSIRRIATTGPGETSVTLDKLGNPSDSLLFAVRARDLANNESNETQPVTATLGKDTAPPSFAGCDAAKSLGATSAEVTWSPATDNHSPASALTYEVFVSTTSKGQDLNAPVAKVAAGTTKATLTGLQPGATYFVSCKVRDGDGNVDTNAIERSFTTDDDITKPIFDGINGFAFDPIGRAVELKWAPASDNKTPANLIVYDVFESVIPGKYDFKAPPRATSAPGAESVIILNLASRAALNWIVRARDATGNRDDNLVERSGTTVTSFSVDVQDVFNRNCAVVGCHVTGPQTGGLNLSPGFSYDVLVDFPSNQNRPSVRVSKAKDLQASWLYLKITDPAGKGGLLMPAPQTGNALLVSDKEIIRSWILEGALRN